MSSLRELLTAAIRDGASPDAAYDAAVVGLSKANLVDHFRPVGVEEARGIRRTLSRAVENHVFGGRGRRRLKVEHEPDRFITVDRAWLNATFSVDGRVLTWGAASAEEHEQRADEQEQRAADISLDAERHRKAAKKIREEGVKALEEVEDLEDLTDD